MFEISLIEQFIEEIYQEKMGSISIYPYGANGKRLKRVLEKCFGIKPKHIIDNYLSEENEEIITEEEFIKLRDEDENVIITIEDAEREEKIREHLVGFIPSNKVHSLLKYREKYVSLFRRSVFERVRVEKIIGSIKRLEEESASTSSNNLVQVRVLHSRKQTFNTIKTVLDEFEKDELFNVKFIIGFDMDQECINQIDQLGFEYTPWTEYDVKQDCPDILILYQPYDYQTQLPGINDYVKLVVVVNTLLIRNVAGKNNFWQIQNDSYLRFRPDYFLCDSLLYNEIKNDQGKIPYEIVEMGNAKFDGIYFACKNRQFPKDWEKINGKTIVLWTTDHGFFYDKVIYTTFDLYAETIFSYAKEHKDMGFIIRPHPEVRRELIHLGYWSTRDYMVLQEYCDQSDNIVYDRNHTYDEAYSVSDAIIADAYCGISVSALPTGKPMCLAYRSKLDEPFYPDIASAYYEARTKDEIVAFLDMIKRGEDDKREKRKEIMNICVKNFDGKNGQRIKEFIKSKYFERVYPDLLNET